MRVSDEEVLQYCDGLLSAEHKLRIDKAALSDHELAYRIKAMDASKLPYAQAFEQQRQPEIPKELFEKLENWKQQVKADKEVPTADRHLENDVPLIPERASSWRLASVAACLAASFFIGFSVSNYQNTTIEHTEATAQSTQGEQVHWVERVANYQTLYVENTVASILSGSAETAPELLSRLEKTAGLQTAIPDLSEHGYTFVRAQELGYEGKPLVQLVYFKPGVAPLALCYMPSSGNGSAELSIGQYESLSTADWIQNGQRFVIVAEESKSAMQRLHELARKHWS